MIIIDNLSKSFGDVKAIDKVSFEIKKGEIFGFLGPNGAGKTTTIRHLLGFIRQDSGSCQIFGLDCFDDASEIHQNLNYLSGEVAFFDQMTGWEFIKFNAELNHNSLNKAKHLVKYFDLKSDVKIKKMSKGMKQKVALVCAFMGEDKVLILDEPTSGLDPLMQKKFVELVLKEKQVGRTILMSSHSFEEIEKTCDRVAIIKQGQIKLVEKVVALAKNQQKKYLIVFTTQSDLKKFTKLKYKIVKINKYELEVWTNNIGQLIKDLTLFRVSDFQSIKPSLEEMFLSFYGESNNV